MVDSRKYCDWLGQARQDLEAAKILHEKQGPTNLAAFHAQQTVEKAYKAYLLFCNGRLQEGHSLAYLNKLCAKHNGDFAVFRQDSIKLNRYYTKTRYPSDFPLQVSQEQVEKFIYTAEKILQKVETKISKC